MQQPHVFESAKVTFGLLYGPVVQFAQPANGQQAASIVAMPPQLPLSVDAVFVYPADAAMPDNVAHFCFAPVLKLHEPSELSFCLTDSSGTEQYGVSLQVLCAHGSSQAKHRPIALCMLSGRPLYTAMSRLLHLLLPLVLEAQRQPTKRITRELRLRCGRDKYGMGLVMSTNNTVMSVEAGGVAARERRLRPGDHITSLDGESLGGVRLSEALRLKAEAEAASGAAPAPAPGAPPGGAVHQLLVTRHFETLPPESAHAQALGRTCGAAMELLRKREQDIRWLVSNPFWLPAPLETLFDRLAYSVPDLAYLLAACLADQKVLLVSADPTILLPCAEALRALIAPLRFSSLYVPYLPATLMSSADAHTLLCDSTSPFLVGTHTSLQQTIAAEGMSLSDELVIANLDSAEVRPSLSPTSEIFPTSLSGLANAAPPLGGLIRRLTPLVSAEKFDEGAVQAAWYAPPRLNSQHAAPHRATSAAPSHNRVLVCTTASSLSRICSTSRTAR